MSSENPPQETESFEVPIEDSIDLHSFLPRDVKAVVEAYLEEAQGVGLGEVRIIHGRGVGTQRQIVRSLLEQHPAVDSFADAPPERGGWGATIARLVQHPTENV